MDYQYSNVIKLHFAYLRNVWIKNNVTNIRTTTRNCAEGKLLNKIIDKLSDNLIGNTNKIILLHGKLRKERSLAIYKLVMM